MSLESLTPDIARLVKKIPSDSLDTDMKVAMSLLMVAAFRYGSRFSAATGATMTPGLMMEMALTAIELWTPGHPKFMGAKVPPS